MDGQLSFATLDYAGKKKRTKRDGFLQGYAPADRREIAGTVACKLRHGKHRVKPIAWHAGSVLFPRNDPLRENPLQAVPTVRAGKHAHSATTMRFDNAKDIRDIRHVRHCQLNVF
jgi:hypothetical protein